VSTATGDCYVVAAKLVAMEKVYPDYLVCHGEATGRHEIAGVRFGHAWIEGELGSMGPVVFDFSNGGNHIVPRERYYEMGEIDPESVRKYTAQEAIVLMLRTGHYGPWDEDPAS
jgi:hypothetical protein